jgi:hypothetical protein
VGEVIESDFYFLKVIKARQQQKGSFFSLTVLAAVFV